MALAPDRRQALHAAKLVSLARNELGIELKDFVGTADGALGWGLASPKGSGNRPEAEAAVAVLLVEQRPEAALGQLLATMKRRECEHGFALCAAGPDLVARRAALFDLQLDVMAIDGTALREVAPTSQPPMKPAPPVALAWVAVIEASGADVVVEHGTVTAEVSGLEVARVIVDEYGDRLEVGVSNDDRAMFSMLHGHMAPPEALAKIVGIVAEQRRAGADRHPLNQLSRSRLLRTHLVADPGGLGLSTLSPAPSPVPRTNLKDNVPAPALGLDHTGIEHVIVASTGVDLELVPFAAHARSVLSPSSPLTIVVPHRDAVDFTTWAVERLARPARVAGISDSWAGHRTV